MTDRRRLTQIAAMALNGFEDEARTLLKLLIFQAGRRAKSGEKGAWRVVATATKLRDVFDAPAPFQEAAIAVYHQRLSYLP
jgi:hypothetical protein